MSAEFSLHCNIVGPNKETFECGFRIIRDQNKTANAGPAASNAYGPAANAYGPVIAICGKTIIRR